jgi:Protein tyrosine and serine/threonine kinase
MVVRKGRQQANGDGYAGYAGISQVVQGLYKGVHPVAVKVLRHVNSDESYDEVMKEVALLRACRHPHIVQVSSYGCTSLGIS